MVAYSIGDACIMVTSQPCTLNLNGTRIHGSKENNVIYWRYYNRVVGERLQIDELATSSEGILMFQLQQNYYQEIGKQLGRVLGT
jgi:hypothetical protein